MQLGAETLATANAEKKNKEASSAVTRGRDISCKTALWKAASGGLDGAGHGVRIHRLEGLRPFMMEISVSGVLLHRRAIGMRNRDLGPEGAG